jgi:hypothetical protein
MLLKRWSTNDGVCQVKISALIFFSSQAKWQEERE